MAVYLLHFSRAYYHARHYLGSTDQTIDKRMEDHRAGRGSKLTRAVVKSGIGLEVVRMWKGGRRREREFKRQHNSPRLCPICNRD